MLVFELLDEDTKVSVYLSKTNAFKKGMTFWFQSLPDYLSPYKLFSNLHNKSFRIWQSLSIPSDNCINMRNLLSSSWLSKYALIIST